MENKNPHINHRRRLYALTEKIGIDNLTDIQAMELLLTYIIPRKDTEKIRTKLLMHYLTSLELSLVFWMLQFLHLKKFQALDTELHK